MPSSTAAAVTGHLTTTGYLAIGASCVAIGISVCAVAFSIFLARKGRRT